ncbi:MAG: histidinol dehydrogenase, partial [Bacteroidota bacterium]|nr:histidinol dehydrogenase [Bacteroidota bacterium]
VREYTEKFDGVKAASFVVTGAEFSNAEMLVDEKLKAAIRLAKNNIEKFHAVQQSEPQKTETMPGVFCWRKNLPIEKVGLYIPGGSAPLFSTVLMLAVPALIAGCREIVLCTPPAKDGSIHPAILFAAKICGIQTVLKIGGVQAIAVMAYGTETISASYKIFGPGNSWVTCAKQLLSREGIAIDLPAGPSELAVYADATVAPAFIAADLLSQAEHGADSQVLVVSTDKNVLENIMQEVTIQLTALPRKKIAYEALKKSHAILVATADDAMRLLNDYAPEHLILACENAGELSGKVINAGSVFLGAWSPESVGDYASGTNHTLPTNGYARAWSGVSVDSFVKKVTFQELTKEGLQNIGPAVELMAEAEGLFAHKNAVTIRLNQK